jgi:SHS2 domain-containing protein
LQYNSVMPPSKSGFEELPHTADWAVRVWAGNLAGLFAEAAHAMNMLAGVLPSPGPLIQKTFVFTSPDPESLLVAFLTELVYYIEQESLVFATFKISINGPTLNVRMSGAPILSLTKAIKAVTYHNLHIRKIDTGFQVEIVFDV